MSAINRYSALFATATALLFLHTLGASATSSIFGRGQNLRHGTFDKLPQNLGSRNILRRQPCADMGFLQMSERAHSDLPQEDVFAAFADQVLDDVLAVQTLIFDEMRSSAANVANEDPLRFAEMVRYRAVFPIR